MNILNSYKINFILTSISLVMGINCFTHQSPISISTRKNLEVVCIDTEKIMAHEQFVDQAQKRYRYIKPVLTACGLSLVLGYFWYTSSSLSDDEIKQIKKIIEEKKPDMLEKSWLDWSKSHASSVGGVAVELIGGALIIPPLSELIGTLTGCAHIVSSLERYDKEHTHCHLLITQIVRDMQMTLAAQAADKPITIGTSELIHACNRLVCRIEKLIGFMRVMVRKFPTRLLRQEAYAIEKRLVLYVNEFCHDIRILIDKPTLDFSAVLELVVHFAQRYAQEMQRFSFLEQDVRDVV
jgi:hypothetical protein